MRVGLGLGLSGRGKGVPPTPAAPVVTSVTIAPASGTVGTLFTAVVTRTGWPPPTLTYQWALDTVPIDGATAATYEAEAEGDLTVTVTATNTEGSDDDTSGAVTVTDAPAAGIGSMTIGSTFQVAA